MPPFVEQILISLLNALLAWQIKRFLADNPIIAQYFCVICHDNLPAPVRVAGKPMCPSCDRGLGRLLQPLEKLQR